MKRTLYVLILFVLSTQSIFSENNLLVNNNSTLFPLFIPSEANYNPISELQYENKPASLFDTVFFTFQENDNGHDFLTVSIETTQMVSSMDFSIKLNIGNLVFDSLAFAAPFFDGAYAYFNESDSTLRFTSFSLQHFQVGVPILKLAFHELGPVFEDDFISFKAFLNGENAATYLNFGITGVNTIDNLKHSLVYPNPANNAVHIRTDYVTSVSILDLNGKLILESKQINIGDNILNICQLNPGLYLIELTENNTIKRVKLMVSYK